MVVVATGFIPLPPVSIVSVMVMWESSQWLGKNIVQSTCKNNSRKAWVGCTGCHDVTEITFKKVINTIQSINQNSTLYHTAKNSDPV